MKLTELSNSILKHMLIEYSKTHNRRFGFDELKSLYPNEDIQFISDAIIRLKKDNLVEIIHADNVPFYTFLQINAITDAEHNTKLRKIYKVLKELKDWV